MQAMTLRHYGGPDVFQQEDLPTPVAQAGEVLVAVRAVAINPVDYKWRQHGPFTTFPVILGWDVAGVVEALGPDVTDFQVGDAVYGMVRFPQEGRAYAEYVAAPAADLALKPPRLSFEEAAATTLAALTAEQVFEAADLQAGQRVLIHAGAGGVGHFAVQLAKARGATVLATGSLANRAFILELGADQFIDYRAQPFEQQVSGVDVVFDTVGGDTQARSFQVLRPGGRLVTIVGTPSAALAEQYGVTAQRLLVHPSRAQLERFNQLIADGALRPHVSQVFPLDRVADAHRAQETGRTVGKLVLHVTGP
ncbi:NADP-dependent oxidoreductase [Deinococcus sonorensis]|uniref:NADP-dependent oxidoreductase n=2 Tax=Deinococcus sonorensis TaxID=309891 RepID=A0AAU7U5K9_9DEIO